MKKKLLYTIATPAGSFAYIGTTPTQKGKTIWLKRVTDEEYKNGK